MLDAKAPGPWLPSTWIVLFVVAVPTRAPVKRGRASGQIISRYNMSKQFTSCGEFGSPFLWTSSS